MGDLSEEQKASIKEIYESRGFTVEFTATHVAVTKGGKVTKLPNSMFLLTTKKDEPGRSPA